MIKATKRTEAISVSSVRVPIEHTSLFIFPYFQSVYSTSMANFLFFWTFPHLWYCLPTIFSASHLGRFSPSSQNESHFERYRRRIEVDSSQDPSFVSIQWYTPHFIKCSPMFISILLEVNSILFLLDAICLNFSFWVDWIFPWTFSIGCCAATEILYRCKLSKRTLTAHKTMGLSAYLLCFTRV